MDGAFIKNAHAAISRLDGELSLRIDRETYLMRVTDDVAALRYYKTIIAWFGRTATKIDTQGWHTRSTWRRINKLTPAASNATNFLRYINQPNGDRVLYEPGICVDPEGMVINPMLPSRQQRIEAAVRDTIHWTRTFTTNVVRSWDGMHEERCECWGNGTSTDQHLLAHVRGQAPHGIPGPWRMMAETEARNGSHGDYVLREVRKRMADQLLPRVLYAAANEADPDFQLPLHNPKGST